jgi:hypothetical protein
MNSDPRLPVRRYPPPQAFEVGQRVSLRSCPGPWGEVVGMCRGRVVVQWHGLNYTGKHKASALIAAPNTGEQP